MEDVVYPETRNAGKIILLCGGERAPSCQERALFEGAGYRVVWAASEERVREEARRSPPDLWLVDLEPGREDEGLQMARHLAPDLSVAPIFRVDPLATEELLRQTETLNPWGYVPLGAGGPFILAALRRGMEAGIARREREEGQFLEWIIRHMSDGVLLTDDQGTIVFVNPEFASFLGEAPEDLLGRSWLDVVLPSQRPIAEAADRRRPQGLSDRYDLVFERRDGGRRTALVGGSPRYDEITGKFIGTMGIVTDITERKKAEGRIHKLLEEKELILQETHHRMKNHMNTMGSILSLHAQTVEDPKAVRALEDARSRMESMAVLYEMLYRHEAPQALSLGRYLPELIRSVVAPFPLGHAIRVETAIDEVMLSPKALSALGLVVNELVSNAMKYAFAGRSRGVLRVTAKHRDGRVRLAVEDDGPGLPSTVDLDRPSGFGLRLVTLLANQLGWTLAVRSGEGACISLDFPVS